MINQIYERRRYGLSWWITHFSTGSYDLENEENPLIHIYPEKKECCGHRCEEYFKCKGNIFTIGGVVEEEAIIYEGICSECGSVQIFDGKSIGVVNFNNRIILDIGNQLIEFTNLVALLGELSQIRVKSGISVSSWWSSRLENQLTYTPRSSLNPSRVQLWRNLPRRLTQYLAQYYSHTDYPADLFQCCANPDIISVDGNHFRVVNY